MAWQRILAALVGILACTSSQITKDKVTELTKKARKLPNDVCGQSDIFKDRPIGGSSSSLGVYPWMAAIGYTQRNKKGLWWMTAGNLITDQYILTVAYVMAPHIPSKFTMSLVRLGEINLDEMANDGASPVDIEVEKAMPHPQYDRKTHTNDIGLLKLKTKVVFDYTKKPICLPPPEFHETSFVGKSGIIIGWGKSEAGGTTSLAETSVEIQNFESCKQNYSRVIPKAIMDERVFCASSPGKDACQGDNGGPLMMLRRYRGKSKMFLLGIISYGYGCAVKGYPGIYTNVSSFMYWIVDNLDI